MPKRYHCEFCNKSFQDTPVARKRHLQGAGHQRNRRLHYDSFMSEGGRGQAMTGRAAILYTEMSGEEILQQWLDSHPEVVERHQKQLRKRGDRGRIEEDRSETGQDRDEREVREPPPQTLQQTLYPSTTRDAKSAPLAPGVGLPLYLQPYSSVLPPSLLPAPSRTAYPHTLLPDDTSGWG